MLDSPSVLDSDDVDGFAVDVVAVGASALPSDPRDRLVGGAEDVLDGDVLLLVLSVVRGDHSGEAVDASDRALPEALMVEVVGGDDAGGVCRVAGVEHGDHRSENRDGGQRLVGDQHLRTRCLASQLVSRMAMDRP